MLGLSALDPLSAAPDPRWRGTRVHALFEDWVRGGATPAGFEAELAGLRAAPARDAIDRAFWDRKSAVGGKGGSVRVGCGGRRILKHKKNERSMRSQTLTR